MKDGIIERYRKRQQEIISKQQEIRSQLERDCAEAFIWLRDYGAPVSFISKSHPDCRYEYQNSNFYRVDLGNNERTMIGTTNTKPFEKYSDEELLVVAKTLDHAVKDMFSLYKGMIEQSADLD